MQFRWTPYDTQELQAIVPDWLHSRGEVYTWRSIVPVVCFNYVHMHHVDRVLRQYGGEQPVPRAPVDVTRYMSSTGRGEDVWWPERLSTWYNAWRPGEPLEYLSPYPRHQILGGLSGTSLGMLVHPDEGGFCHYLPLWMTHGGCLHLLIYPLPPNMRGMSLHCLMMHLLHAGGVYRPAARGRRGGGRGRGGRLTDPARPPTNARDRRRRIRMGEDYGDAGDVPHVSPIHSSWLHLNLAGSWDMPPPAHDNQPDVGPSSQPGLVQSPDPYLVDVLDRRALDEVFDMVRAPDTVAFDVASSYLRTRDHRLDPNSFGFDVSVPPPHTSVDVQHSSWDHSYGSPSGIVGYQMWGSGQPGMQYDTPPSYQAPTSYHSHETTSAHIAMTSQPVIASVEPSPPHRQ
ncbi:hypothetical protein PIB30_058296 [Stylosanthes scabra]|uniref:Aminotransferase-like plant mobile domain-containing protein n=1 Tax=Stylosanthes scabra TaxID=79078 RepID=A0ABU6YK76_9FABA|nr:hypothetical protein [Stylosanthes scabra]